MGRVLVIDGEDDLECVQNAACYVLDGTYTMRDLAKILLEYAERLKTTERLDQESIDTVAVVAYAIRSISDRNLDRLHEVSYQ